MDLGRIGDYFAAFVCMFGSAVICISGIIILHLLK